MESGRLEPIAVVGMGCAFPGATSPEAFWDVVASGRDLARSPPAGRWSVEAGRAVSPDGTVEPDRVRSPRACFVEGFELDRTGLVALPAGLDELDPLYHLVLHAGRDAFLAGETTGLDRSRIGVVLASIALPTDGANAVTRKVLGRAFVDRLHAVRGSEHADQPTSELTLSRAEAMNTRVVGLPAAILAHALQLRGSTCYTLDAACASSLYALHLACEELRAGRADAMLAGGASRPDSLYTQMGFSALRALSPSGRCAPFDHRADGLVVGEGAGVFLLKRLGDAVTAGDRIHAILPAIGVANDMGGSLLAPDTEGQLRAMRMAYDASGWDPRELDLIECHGTGTPAGDGIEIESLRQLWGADGWRGGQCVVGSVKSQVGHLLTGAGAAGLMKVILGLQHEQLPPQANFERPAAQVPLDGSPFRVIGETCPWPRPDPARTRRAAVNAFGFGGINAHVLVEEWQPAAAASSRSAPRAPAIADDEPIAIIGMAARMGTAADLRALQEASFRGEAMGSPRPPGRWNGLDSVIPESLRDVQAGWLDELAFAPGEVRVPPAELVELLPQQLVMLQIAGRALEDAGLPRVAARPRMGALVGVALDMGTTSFQERWDLEERAATLAAELGLDLGDPGSAHRHECIRVLRDAAWPVLSAPRVMGNLASIIASRIAREFKLGGASFVVSSEETSGITALELARRALQRGEMDAALVGAVDLPADLRNVLATGALRSPGAALPHPFAETRGTTPAEGAVALVLERLSDAIRGGRRIYGVLRGIGASAPHELMSPSAGAYRATLERAYTDAGIEPVRVSYLEAHGSGDPTEDSVEAQELCRFFARPRREGCAVGSLPATLGLAGAAAGLAAVARAALCLYQEVLPPLPGFTEPRASDWQGSGLHLPIAPLHWLRDREDGARVAGVSSIGLDGGAAHVVLEAADDPGSAHAVERLQPLGARSEAIFALRGDSPEGLALQLESLADHARANGGTDSIEALARRWYAASHDVFAAGNPEASNLAIVAGDGVALAAAVQTARAALARPDGERLDGRDGVFYSPQPLRGGLAFVFPGSGNAVVGMGRTLQTSWPEVLRDLDAGCRRLAGQLMPWDYAPWRTSWPPGWQAAAQRELATDAVATIQGQVAAGIVCSEILRHLGIRPEAFLGYSLGETTSLFASRSWRDRDAILERLESSPIFTSELAGSFDAVRRTYGLPATGSVDWKVVVVNRPAGDVRAAAAATTSAELMMVNSASECVLGGLAADVDAALAALGCRGVAVPGAQAVHCRVVAALEEAYREFHTLPTTSPAPARVYSSHAGASYPVDRESAARALTAHAVHGFEFPRVVEQAYADGIRIFVESAPGSSCTRLISQILRDRPHLVRPACQPGRDEVSSVLRLVAALLAEGAPVDLDSLYGGESPVVAHRAPRPAPPATIRVGIEPELGALDWPVRREETPAPSEPPPSPAPAPASRRTPSPPRPAPTPVEPPSHPPATPDSATARAVAAMEATAAAHEAFLEFSEQAQTGFGRALESEARLRAASGAPLPTDVDAPAATPRRVAYDRDLCLEFAIGSVAKVLGDEFAVVDTYPVRVRLPDEPLMLVDRILEVEGEKGSLGPGRLVTEHDVHPDAWYLDNGCTPTFLSVEAGQADLFLSAYLGIDLAVQGTRSYRLLDAIVCFQRHLPRAGEVIRYDIRIRKFARQGETYLFFFEFDGTIAGQPLLTMREGVAGFFTAAEVENSGGVILTEDDLQPRPGVAPADWRALGPPPLPRYSDAQIEALRAGDLGACFGDAFGALGLVAPSRLPTGRLELFDRVLELDPAGGRFGLGLIVAEADIHPDDWFLTCHFVDDMVMPGTLMYECCAHTLRFFLMAMGWVGEESQVTWEPLPGVNSRLSCRGPVTPQTRRASYRIEIKEIGHDPAPYAIADALMFADDRRVVLVEGMSVAMNGASRADLEALWAGAGAAPARADVAPIGDAALPTGRAPAIFDYDRILAFSDGRPSEAFGEPYRVFDSDRRIARLPRPPFQLLDRITQVHAEPWTFRASGWIEGQYDVPPDAWYLRANRQRTMPFAVLLEIALQPCGWLAAFVGSALQSDEDISFRNLGGDAILHAEVHPDDGVLTTRVRMTKCVSAGGQIIQEYDMQIWRRDLIVYDGSTSFGFFSAQSLANQVGVRGADDRAYEPTAAERERGASFPLEDLPPRTPDDGEDAPAPGLALPAAAWRMADRVELLVPDGGPHGLGFVRGAKAVNPEDWFFLAHFFQDPVWPGSLGLESFLQLLKVLALERWPALRETHRFEAITVGRPHRWIYRGQIVPANREVTVDAVVTRVEEGAEPTLTASGFLRVDGKIIYEMVDFGLRLVPLA